MNNARSEPVIPSGRHVGRHLGFALTLLTAAALSACGGGSKSTSSGPEATQFSGARPMATADTSVRYSTDTLVGQLAGYTPTNANEEGYWYSRYNMMALTMQSGLGESFMPSMADMQMAMLAAAQNPVDPVMAPVNPALLSVVYAGGDPRYVTAPNPMDFGSLRWRGGSTESNVEASAWTITKEIEWAKLFHVDAHFGTPTDAFGATQRFAGMMFAPMVKMQLMTLQQNPGRFETSKLGDFALLTAYSDAAGFFGAVTMPHSTSNRYADPTAAQADTALAQAQFRKVLRANPENVRERSAAIQSVVWYASVTKDPAERALAREAIVTWADGIAAKVHATPVDRAYAIRGLIEAGRTTGLTIYLDQAAAVYVSLIAGFDANHGVLAGTERLTTEGVGAIAGAFNAAGLFLGARIDQAALPPLFGAWWEGTVNLSGFQTAAPALMDFKGSYETQQDPLNLRYPKLPLPQDVTKPFGSAPVFAASVTWTGKGWQANQRWFDTAGAMHTSNEFVWFHNDEVNGFPEVLL